MKLTEQIINDYFNEMSQDISQDIYQDMSQKLDNMKKVVIKFHHKLPECDFDTLIWIIRRNNRNNQSEEPMILRFSSVKYGCDNCKCVHNIPYISPPVIIKELDNIMAKKPTILGKTRREALKGMLMIGEYKNIIPKEIVEKWVAILSEPHKYISVNKRLEIHNYLIEVANTCYDPRYIINDNYIRNLRKQINEIVNISLGYGPDWSIYVMDGYMDKVKEEIENITEISVDWFKFLINPQYVFLI